jgi:two-component system response regulator FixJ
MPGSFVERTEFLRGAQTTVSRIMANTTTDAFCSSSLVCVVDRDELVRTRLKGVLQRLGVVVEVFTSAEDFLANPQTDVTDCLIAELELPGISGIELQQHLRNTRADCPVILISHTDDIATAVNAIQLGAFDFIEKPFMNRVIFDLVRHALQQVVTLPADRLSK